jgi:putative SOS response-associated peptidase YedK
MCGRYTDTRRDKALLTRMGVMEQTEFLPRYNVAPTQDAWVVARDDDGATRIRKMRWGLIPFWAENATIGNKMINAQSETAADRPAFRNAFRQRRCLVLADGFYEWRTTSRRKIPYYIRLKNGRPFVFAGLWERWRGPNGPLESFCVLTGPANSQVAEIHDRMPIILDEESCAEWINPEADAAKLQALLRPYDSEMMESFQVSTLVNSPHNEQPGCVEPVPLDQSKIEAPKSNVLEFPF